MLRNFSIKSYFDVSLYSLAMLCKDTRLCKPGWSRGPD